MLIFQKQLENEDMLVTIHIYSHLLWGSMQSAVS